MAVVTVSRQYGAGGSSVATVVARRLGAEVLDKKLIEQVAARLAMEPEEVEQEEERPRTLLEKMVRSFGAFEPPMGSGWSPPYPDPLFDPRKEILELTEQVVREAASAGNVVIVGRGAGFILKELPDLLRVFLWAPEPDRIRTLMARFGFTEAVARRKMHETDANRAAYMRQVYGADWTEVSNYDLVLNTGCLGYDAAADAIMLALKSVAASHSAA
jgi:cytidylate kinase